MSSNNDYYQYIEDKPQKRIRETNSYKEQFLTKKINNINTTNNKNNNNNSVLKAGIFQIQISPQKHLMLLKNVN